MKQGCKFDTYDIPGPFTNKKWIFHKWLNAEIHVIGIQCPVNKADDRHKQLTSEKDLPPGTPAGSHTKYPGKIYGGQDDSTMGEVILIEKKTIRTNGKFRRHDRVMVMPAPDRVPVIARDIEVLFLRRDIECVRRQVRLHESAMRLGLDTRENLFLR